MMNWNKNECAVGKHEKKKDRIRDGRSFSAALFAMNNLLLMNQRAVFTCTLAPENDWPNLACT